LFHFWLSRDRMSLAASSPAADSSKAGGFRAGKNGLKEQEKAIDISEECSLFAEGRRMLL